ncbi:UNVERIFIED_CONTAM: putative E3 ubiquitin-protein ligase SINA-like 6 [Sesamum radiatum]|uniref:E3 ubiquitin-protein ligase SINA-like 6 n=1 Tax=Sesamum radiatum TaxID=300843 RepID=A0AAW2V4S5_SESRA
MALLGVAGIGTVYAKPSYKGANGGAFEEFKDMCENGHIACASCCIKMRNKCASCSWPIGYNRCRALEKVLESIRVSCRNMQHGCTESLNYSKKLDHEKTCKYAPCSCPHPDCNYVGLPKSLYTHFAAQHSRSSTQFRFNYGFPISLDNSQTHVFLQEKTESILFILNRSFEPLGSFVNVMCIAPTSFKREFSYELTAKDGFSSIKLKTIAESTPQWITQPPVKKCVLVPNDFITSAGQLKLEVTIWKERESPISSSRCSSLLQTPK